MRVSRQEKIDAITAWTATPAELRPVPTLRQLALSIGAPPDGTFYRLAESPEVAQQILGIAATMTLPQVPDVLGKLYDMALSGNIRAAEVFLNHVRLVITAAAEKLPTRKPVDPHRFIEDSRRAASRVLEVAQKMVINSPKTENLEAVSKEDRATR